MFCSIVRSRPTSAPISQCMVCSLPGLTADLQWMAALKTWLANMSTRFARCSRMGRTCWAATALGTLALEMARQLMASGETVGFVGMIETYNIRALRWPLPLHQRAINRFILNPFFHLQNLLEAEGEGKSASSWINSV